MPLVVATLKSQLELNWLVPEGGTYPDTVQVSADHFATAVASWFSAAQANGIPCTTAMARKSQLSGQAASALAAGDALAAGQALAGALSAYMAGQTFGAGVSAAPLGTAIAATALGGVFSNLDLSSSDRAQQIAQACQDLAVTTVVTFPSPMPPANVT